MPASLCSCPQLVTCCLCPSRCDRALLAPDGGESHDVFLCVPVVWQSCKNQHFPVLWIPLPFCQVGITLQKAPVPMREQFGGIQELLSLEQLLLVQPVLWKLEFLGTFFFVKIANYNGPETVVTVPLKSLSCLNHSKEPGNKRAGIKCIPQCPSLLLTTAV